MLHSIYDLTTYCRKTTGDVPAKLVGASTTVVGSKMYLFGGRLVAERKMVSDLYLFDLETFVWEKVHVHPDDDIPQARYFHSADTWGNQLIIFGGMSNQPDSINPDELCVLSDVRIFDIPTGRWLPPSPPSSASDPLVPRPRYAHLSSVTAHRLFIIGGQDFNNTWLDDICIYDLVRRAWVQRRDYPRHCGTYRSVAVSSNTTVRLPQEERRNFPPSFSIGPPGQRFGPGGDASALEPTPAESLIHLPYSAPPTDDYPSDVYLYSNYNFTDVKRELEVFSPLPETGFAIHDKSSAMAGATFPPGLRFPTGALLGTHLIIAGTYLAHSYQSFSIWVLDLLTMTWSRIDPGKAIESGSWFRGCLYADCNKFIIFGNKHANLVDDYNRRLLSWDHVAVVDLEAFGIYQPPPLQVDITMQELGLSALEEGIVTDFDIVCDDGRTLTCSRRILEDRWPWFAEEYKKFLTNAKQAADALPSSAMDVGLPDLPGTASPEGPRVDPRLTPRSFHLSEPYPITLALLQYFYTLALTTPLQHAPAVLSQLLVLSTNYRIKHLETLVKHAMHRALSNSTSVGVYEVATLCSCRSLQIRALKTVMSYTQKRPSRSRVDRDGGGGKPPGGASGGGGPSGGGGGDGSGNEAQFARPRGTSDARFRMMGDPTGFSTSGYLTRNVITSIDGAEDDQITPLPVLVRRRSQRRSRPQSTVSIRTEGEINDLADFMSSSVALGTRTVDSPSPYTTTFGEDPLDPNPLFTTRKSHSLPSTSTSTPIALTASSSSDSIHHFHHHHHHNHYFSDSSAEFHLQLPPVTRSRRPRISTDSMPGLTPSLNSVSTGRFNSAGPTTPTISFAELPSPDHLLSIIDERRMSVDDRHVSLHHHHQHHDDDHDHLDNDPFSPPLPEKELYRQTRVHAWPQKKSDIRWIHVDPVSPEYTQVVARETEGVHYHLTVDPLPPPPPPAVLSQLSLVSSKTSSSSPRTPPAFARLFRKFSDDKMFSEEEREERRLKKEEAKAKREQMRIEKAQRELQISPLRPLVAGRAF